MAIGMDVQALDRELAKATELGVGCVVVVTLGEVNTVSIGRGSLRGGLQRCIVPIDAPENLHRASLRKTCIVSPTCAEITVPGYISTPVRLIRIATC